LRRAQVGGHGVPAPDEMARHDDGSARDLTGALLRQVSRSFYLSVAVLPGEVRPAVGLAYLLARAADTVADTRVVPRERRTVSLAALREGLGQPSPDRARQIVEALLPAHATMPGPALDAERALLERLPDCFVAYRRLDPGDRERVRRLLETIIEGQIGDLDTFPGEDADKLEAVESREALDRYTYLVAGCVGEFWTDLHAAHRPRLRGLDLAEMRRLGVRFGKGLQMTNVLRDLARDFRIGRCYLPRQDLGRLGLSPRDLLDPAALPAARPLLDDLLRLTLGHYDAGWRYTLAIPVGEWRMRLACVWPLVIGLRTLALLSTTPDWLDPAARLKVPRRAVRALLARSLMLVWSNRALRREAERLRARVRA
jgi:farnesyl-diphosphate farnesyltransferase